MASRFSKGWLYDDRERVDDPAQPMTPSDRLVQAVLEEDVTQVERLLREGVDPNAPGFLRHLSRSDLPLRVACDIAHQGILARLLDAGADPARLRGTMVPSRPDRRDTAYGRRTGVRITQAIEREDVADLLIGHGWLVTQEDRDHQLLFAAAAHRPDLVARWLSLGANPNAVQAEPVERTGPGRTTGNAALHLAIGIQSAANLVEEEACLDVVRRLLDAGAAVDQRNDQGYTPFLLGVLERYMHTAPGAVEQAKALHVLLDAGTDVNLKGPLGTAMLWALENRRHDGLAQRLVGMGARLEYGVNPLCPDNVPGPGSALLGALFNGSVQQVRLALELGEDPNRPAITLFNTCSWSKPGELTAPLVRCAQRLVDDDDPDDFEQVLTLLQTHGLDLITAARDSAWKDVQNRWITQSSGSSARQERNLQRMEVVRRHLEVLELRAEADQEAPNAATRARARL